MQPQFVLFAILASAALAIAIPQPGKRRPSASRTPMTLTRTIGCLCWVFRSDDSFLRMADKIGLTRLDTNYEI